MKKILLSVFYLSLILMPTSWAKENPSGEINTYSNPEVGVQITKPSTWYFISKEKLSENRKAVRLKDEALTKFIQENAKAPLAVIMKYNDPENRSGIIPTVQLVVYSIKAKPDATASDILNNAINILKKGTRDFKILEEVSETKISGLPAATARFSFSMQDRQKKDYTVKTRSYIIKRNDLVFSLGLAGPAEGPDVSDQEFEQIFSSLKIEP